MLTYDDAIASLNALKESGNLNLQKLRELADQVSIDARPGYTQGSVTLLYSGPINGVDSVEYIDLMMQSREDIRVIDKTHVGKFLADSSFKNAWREAGGDIDSLNHGANGPWARASARFIADTAGEVRVLTLGPRANSVFVMTELKKALADGSQITHIEGLPVADLKRLSFGDALKAVISASVEHVGYGGLKVSATSVTVGDFLDRGVLDTQEYIKSHPESTERFKDFFRNGLNDADRSRIKAGARGLVKSLGTMGSALLLGIALTESANAAEAGKTEEARKIMETWAIDAAGSSAGAAIGSTVVAIAAGAAVAAGAAISAPVLAALAIGGAIVGGIWGSKTATDAWSNFRGSADESELNLLEKLSAQWALSDYHLVFGTAQGDTLNGTTARDYLFGGGGNDTLSGMAGDDELRGGAGDDRLDGGAGSDVLTAQTGNDYLDGGAGSDRLEGGDGADTYSFSGDFGNDSILDSDGNGSIVVDGQTLSGAATHKVRDGFYSDGSWNFNVVNNGSGGSDLLISRDGQPGSIRVRNWLSGQLGISLNDTPEQPDFSSAITGGYAKQTTPDGTQYEIGADGNYAAAGAQPDSPDVLNGGAGNDQLLGLAGNDGLAGGAGDDSIEGGDGDDLILGGDGADTINGGQGNDEILGSAGGLINRPISTGFTPPTAAGTEIARGFSWVIYQPSEANVYMIAGTSGVVPNGETSGNVIDGGAGNDRIGAGSAGDVAYGGTGDDTIVGMGGADYLHGDDGADVIDGDGPDGFHGWATTTAEHGNDIVSGDGGNDRIRGQGGADILYGGADNDTLYGDDTDLSITPVSIHGNDYLDGGSGDDKLIGGAFNDELYGDDGADSLWGDAGAVDPSSESYLLAEYQGDDYLDGEGGTDYLQGEGGNDTLFGGADSDTLVGDDSESRLAGSVHGADYLDGEAGDDQLAGLGGADTLYGGAGADLLDGDGAETDISGTFHGADYLDGEDGNDELYGRGGADTLYGGEGDDKLQGDSAVSSTAAQYHGDDYLDGEAGNDSLYGQGGADTLVGGDGADYLDGDAHSDDVPVANHGDDVLWGDAGADTLIGGGGNDQLDGGTEDDLLQGDLTASESGHGADTLDGGDGNDVLYGDGGDDVLYGGAGNDWIAGEDQISADAVSSLSGNDYLDGGDGNDTLLGGNGNDWLDGGSGTDVLLGGAGQDTYVLAFDGSTKEVIDEDLDSVFQLGADTTAVMAQRWTGPTAGTGDQYLTIELGTSRIQIKNGLTAGTQAYHFSDGTQWTQDQLLDHITTPILLNGGDGGDSLRGGGGDDSLSGGDGDDIIVGGAGVDLLAGGTGNDIVDGGTGGATSRGDEGNDTYRFKRGDGLLTIDNTAADWATANDVVHFGAGITASDVAVNRVGNDLRMTLLNSSDTVVISNYYLRSDAYYRVAQVQFDDGTSWSRTTLEGRVSPEGTAGSDYLTGTANNDLIHGGAGMDYLYGLAGDDQLYGDADSDSLYGGLGNDWLDGGAGTDNLDGDVGNDTLVGGETMYGGSGNDTYIIDTRPTSTLVVSDSSGVDELLLPSGVTPASVSVDLTYTYWPNYDALLLGLGSGGFIRVDGYFSSQAADSIEQIRFADGTVWDRAEVMSRVPSSRLSDANDSAVGYVWDDFLDGLGGNDSLSGRTGNDTLLGGAGQDSLRGDQGNDSLSGGEGDDTLFGDSEQYTSAGDGNDLISGGDGNDSLYGAGGQDTLDGGSGVDYVLGGDGNDVYLLSRGSGNDSFYDSAGADRIVFGSDVAPSSVTLWRDGVDLVIAVDQTVLQARFLSHFNSSANTLDSIQFSDGTIWDSVGIAARTTSGTVNTMIGTAGDDLFLVDDAGDTINETLGGIDTVQSSVSWTLGANLENLTFTGFLNLRGTGNSLNNVITGNSGNNTLDGLAGVDTLIGGAGDDTFNVVAGEDTVIEAAGGGEDTVVTKNSYALPDNVENLKLTPSTYTRVTATGNALNNVISISGSLTSGNIIDGGAGADTLICTDPYSALFYVDNIEDKVITGGGVVISTVNWTMPLGVKVLQLTGAAKDGVGNAENNVLIGTGQNGVLQGLGGDDALYSNSSNSGTLQNVNYPLSWNSYGVDTLVGGTGNDSYYISAAAEATDVVVEAAGEGTDTVYISTGLSRMFSINEFANVENLRLDDYSANASLTGDSGANQLYGSRGNNELIGGGGDDILVDRSGFGALGTYEWDSDTLDGGDGNDQLTSAYGSDVLDGGAGNDSVSVASSSISATILFGRGDGADTVTLAGAGARRFVLDSGIIASDLLVARNQRDLLLSFGQGDSLTLRNYFADANSTTASGQFTSLQFADGLVFSEQALISRMLSGNSNSPTEGADVIIGSPAPDVFDGLGGDDLILGGSGADALTGGAGSDTLAAGDGDDSLRGGLGSDLLRGEAGNDTYQFVAGDGVDVVEESGGIDAVDIGPEITPDDVTASRSGDDLLLSMSSGADQLTLKGFFAATANEVEEVRFSDGTTWTASTLKAMGSQFIGTAGADAFNGTSLDEKFFGLAGNDVINAGAGNDSLDGGEGHDTLTGGAGMDTLIGGLGDDLLDPGTEFDIITFGRGSGADRITNYYAGGDEIQFESNVAPSDLRLSTSGVNLVISIAGTADSLTVEQFTNYWNQVSLRFADGTTWSSAQIWQALTTITGTDAAEILTGTASSDRIFAYGGNDTVDGGTGNDLIDGGLGDDSLTGGAGFDTLDGGAGIDRMTGGSDDDMYVVDNALDVVVEAVGGGYDWIESSVSYTLPSNVEEIYLTGSGNLAATGNTLDNYISGNAGNNTLLGGSGNDWLGDYEGGNDSLDGGTGNDTMEGGIGDDTYVVNSTLDQVFEYADEGNDLVQASASFALPDEVERLTLTGTSGFTGTGNALANVLTGNAGANRLDGGDGNDTIDGGSGSDTMIGGNGDDVYYVNVATDVVTEAVGGGTDTIFSSVTLTALAANVENITLTGTSNRNATGNALANVLIGNSGANSLSGGDGNDTIDGGTGNDTMVGGNGDDTFFVNVSTDVVTEAAGGGTDTVMSAVTYTLGTNLEKLTLTGSSAINGAGNTVANVLTGNSGANTLTGNAGTDTLDGGAGNDSLVGGADADVYRFGLGYGVDTVSENDATANVKDAVQFVGSVTQSDVQFKQVGNNLEVMLNGTSDKIVVQNWYLGSQYQVEEFRFTDGTILTNVQAQGRVTAGASASAVSMSIQSADVTASATRLQINQNAVLPLADTATWIDAVPGMASRTWFGAVSRIFAGQFAGLANSGSPTLSVTAPDVLGRKSIQLPSQRSGQSDTDASWEGSMPTVIGRFALEPLRRLVTPINRTVRATEETAGEIDPQLQLSRSQLTDDPTQGRRGREEQAMPDHLDAGLGEAIVPLRVQAPDLNLVVSVRQSEVPSRPASLVAEARKTIQPAEAADVAEHAQEIGSFDQMWALPQQGLRFRPDILSLTLDSNPAHAGVTQRQASTLAEAMAVFSAGLGIIQTQGPMPRVPFESLTMPGLR